ncbi:nucleotidyl transferase AbiEii/AbiGii toxin family protein [bacterium]|nr:MAG: nucleotidyl transferase AbiEii/AbiGii toxin family protein [bacterium]
MSLDSAIHKNILLQILIDIYSDNTIGPFLGFKGGTAAYLFFGLERFSVDLDFDLLDVTKEDYVFERVEKIVKKYGVVKEAEKKRFNLLFILAYNNKEENAQNVKIEINRRNFGSKYKLKSYMGISMLVMTKEDMFANKLVAMFERIGKANRDIFDVWFFSKNIWSINKTIVENRSEMSFKEFLENCISELEKKNNRDILNGLGELVDEKQKMWIKSNLKKDALLMLKLKLNEENDFINKK